MRKLLIASLLSSLLISCTTAAPNAGESPSPGATASPTPAVSASPSPGATASPEPGESVTPTPAPTADTSGKPANMSDACFAAYNCLLISNPGLKTVVNAQLQTFNRASDDAGRNSICNTWEANARAYSCN